MNIEIIKKWHNDFSARDFFDPKNPRAITDTNSACAEITDNQVVNILSNGTGAGNHRSTHSLLDLSIIGKDVLLNDSVISDSMELSADEWQMFNYYRVNNIDIDMINEDEEYVCYVIIPDKISMSKYQLLEAYLHKLKSELGNIFENRKLFYYSDDHEKTNDIDEILDYAKTKIDVNITLSNDNNILGYTYEELTNKLGRQLI